MQLDKQKPSWFTASVFPHMFICSTQSAKILSWICIWTVSHFKSYEIELQT